MMKKQKISPELLRKIKDAVNIIEVIGEHVVLRKAGANYTGLCPFHSERTPSFSVSENKQLYHCYGCKKGGDVVSFVMDLHGSSFPEAIEDLAERAKIQLPRGWEGEDSGDPETQKRRAAAREKTQLALRLNRFVAGFYHAELKRDRVAADYFRDRGVGEELGREFYVGVAQASWDSLASFLHAKKAPLELAAELGLIRPSPKNAPARGVGYFDLFRNRAMFPILDLRGKVVGFGGRNLPGADSGKDDSGPKYMNSPESPIFHKSKIAFGLFQAQKYIREKDEVVLVEGYFDVLALHAAGFKNVVATCGTALTAEHLQLFRKFASRVTLLFDGDKAGISATESAMELGLAHGQVLFGATMPAGRDPDEILFSQTDGKPQPGGFEKMSAILAGARPLLDARIEEAVADAAKDAETRTQAIKRVAAWLSRFTDPVGREVRVADVQKRLGIDRGLLAKAAPAPERGRVAQAEQPQTQARRAGSAGAMAKSSPEHSPGRLTEGDKILLWALSSDNETRQKLIEIGHKLPPEVTIPDLFDYAPAAAFVTQLMEDKGDLSACEGGLTRFLTPDLDIQVRSVVTEAVMTSQSPYQSEDLDLTLSRAIHKVWARFSQRIKMAMHDAEAKKDAGLHEQLSKEYLDVQRKMKEFTSFI